MRQIAPQLVDLVALVAALKYRHLTTQLDKSARIMKADAAVVAEVATLQWSFKHLFIYWVQFIHWRSWKGQHQLRRSIMVMDHGQ